MAWLKTLSLAWKLAFGLTLVLLAVLAFNAISGGARKATEQRIEANRNEAAIESGSDAVETVGAAGQRDAATDAKVQETQDEVDDAKDGASADAAGRNGLCVNFGLCPEG